MGSSQPGEPGRTAAVAGARLRDGTRRSIAMALLLATLSATLVGGCREAVPSPSPTPVPTPSPTPPPISGEVGSSVTLGSLVVFVRGSGEAPERLQTLGTEMRVVGLAVTISALGGPAQLDAGQVQLVDASDGTRYALGSSDLEGTFTWPLTLTAGASTDGTLGFTVPRGREYVLRIVAGPALVAEIAIGRFPAGGIAIVATPPPDGSPSPSPSESATPSVTPTPDPGAYSASRAKAYQDTVFALYAVELPDFAAAMKRATTASQADKVARNAIAAIDAHLGYLLATPAPKCYQDAYATDRQMAALWKKAFGLRKKGDYGGARLRSDRFVTELLGYFSDCR